MNDQRDVVTIMAGLGSGDAVVSAEEMEDMLCGKEKPLLARERKKRGRYWSSSRRGSKFIQSITPICHRISVTRPRVISAKPFLPIIPQQPHSAMSTFAFDPIEEALAAFKAGEFVVVMDDEGRENEGDLVIAASECTTKKMAWFIKHTRWVLHFSIQSFTRAYVACSGYICISLPEERLKALDIPMMVPDNQERHKTAYTVTVDAKEGQSFPPLSCRLPRSLDADADTPPGTSTGISAHDRALTARLLASPTAKPEDFTRPGHMVPLRYTDGGVLARPGHTEAATGSSPPVP